MGTAKRITLIIFACFGWGASVGILAASLVATEVILSNSFFYGRLFALLALISAVITLGLWNETARARHVIPVEEAWKVGVAFGANYARLVRLSKRKIPTPEPMPERIWDWDTFMQTPVQNGQQDSPPIWPRR